MVLFALFWVAAITVLLVIALEFLTRLIPSYKLAKQLPGPGVLPFWKTVKLLYELTPTSTFDLPRNWCKEFKQTYVTWALVRMNLEVSRAREMEIVLASSKHNQKGIAYDLLRAFLGDGLLASNGSKWQHRRRILTPAFHFSILQQFLLIFRDESKKLVQILNKESQQKDGTILAPVTSRFTLNTICETSMGVKLDSLNEADEYRRKIYDVGELLLERFLKPWLHAKQLYQFSINKLKMDRLLKPIHGFTRNIIIQRRNTKSFNDQLITDIVPTDDIHDNIYDSKKRRYAMLDTLLAAEAKGEIDAEGIREEVDTFTFEGHDTTSSGLIFIFLLLAHNRDVQDKVFEEIKAIRDSKADDEALTTTDYNDMTYTDRVIKECFRIYPPVPFISRNLTEDILLQSGHRVPTGTNCHLHIFDLHRDPEQFPDPEVFDPERFTPENCETRHPFAYLPFSAGPRNCIGQKFALLEIKTALEHVLLNFYLTPVTTREEIIFIADIVLRTKTPVRVKFNRRITSK